MKQYQVTVRPRHLRHMFFIDESTSYEKLNSIILLNQAQWGGWFNPIVPVREGVIEDSWINIISHYDPDYIFYSKKIDPEIIFRLKCFNPIEYIELGEDFRKSNSAGVNAFNFLSQFPAKSNIILTSDTWKTKSPLLSYYKLNFGLEENLIHHQIEFSREHKVTHVSSESFNTINRLIHELKPIIPSQLSRNSLNTKILRPKPYLRANFEIVVARNKSSNDDLLYYWNRKLFELRRILYCTLEELELLCVDEYFGKVLEQLDFENTIHITSTSLSQIEIEEIVDTKLKPVSKYLRFEVNQMSNKFPCEVLDANGLFERNYGEVTSTIVIPGNESIIQLPELSFTKKLDFFSQSWIVDIAIKEYGGTNPNEIKYPLTTDTRYIIKGNEGRINLQRNVSILINSQQQESDTLNISLPNIMDLASQLIMRPVINGQSVNNKYVHIGHHDDSNKLNGFLNLFNRDLHSISDFFSDDFWVSIFEELSTSEKTAGDAICFYGILDKCKDRMQNAGVIELTYEGKIKGNKNDTYINEENLVLGLKNTMEELCQYRVFLKGYNSKCPHCSSRFWYSIKDVGESLNCKGCYNNYDLPVEPAFAYKLNDLVKNNIFQTPTSRNGNLTVIRTLALLSNVGFSSFSYTAQLNLYSGVRPTKISGDIDIFCIENGKLIIGEAKHDSKAFTENRNKSLKSLVDVAKTIRPDKIVLSCYEDTNDKLAKAKHGLIHAFNRWEYQPEIETIAIGKPDDFHLKGHRYFYD